MDSTKVKDIGTDCKREKINLRTLPLVSKGFSTPLASQQPMQDKKY